MKVPIGHFVMEQVTNISVPIGGDKAPIAKLKITTIANWISLMPVSGRSTVGNDTFQSRWVSDQSASV